MPPRRIIHVDMDAFYASVEQRDRPELRGRPVAVGGRPESRGVVAAASYEARRYGVRSAIPMARAVRQCPNLEIVRPDFAKYRAVSQQVFEIYRLVTPLVEPLSLDEAYLDVTENAWHEPLGKNVAKRLKVTIRERTGLTASAGVAPNKFLAKIASAWQKPDGLTVIAPERVESFLQQLPVDALWGVGPVTASRLRERGITRLVDVRTADAAVLREAVGSLSEWLQERGLAARTVTIKVRYDDFTTITRSDSTTPTSNLDQIQERAVRLLAKTEAGRRPVRLLGAGVHNFVDPSAIEPAPDGWLPF